jgi:hypothetical protein
MPRGPRLVLIASATALAASMFIKRTSFFLEFSLQTDWGHGLLHAGSTHRSPALVADEGDAHLNVSPFATRGAAAGATILSAIHGNWVRVQSFKLFPEEAYQSKLKPNWVLFSLVLTKKRGGKERPDGTTGGVLTRGGRGMIWGEDTRPAALLFLWWH